MSIRFRLGLALAVVLMAGCSGSSDRASLSTSPKDGGGSQSSPPSALPLAEQLLTHPTAALVKQAAADHIPTANEQTLVAVYWAFLANAYTTGTFDPVFLQSGIQAAVLKLASEYPSFFQVSDGGRVSYVLDSIVIGQTTFTCADLGCTPSVGTLFTVGTEGATAIGGLLGKVTSPALGLLFNAAQIALASGNLEAALNTLTMVNANQVLAVIEAVAVTAVGVFALVEPAGFVSVLAIYAETIFVVDLNRLLSAMDAFNAWETMHACGSSCCDVDFTCNEATSQCCPNSVPNACGSTCCATACADPTTSTCSPCPVGDAGSTACGTSCCTSSQTCADFTQNLCCATGSGPVCGSTCCNAGDSCMGGSCCPSAQACGSVCCGSGLICQDSTTGTCSPCPVGDAGSTVCGTSCCTSSQTCADFTQNLCCATGSGPVCGSTCCNAGDSCVGGACCPSAQACGSVCCGSGLICQDSTTGTCSPCPVGDAGSTVCGTSCCTSSQTCADFTTSLCCDTASGPVCGGICCPSGQICIPSTSTCASPTCGPSLALCGIACCLGTCSDPSTGTCSCPFSPLTDIATLSGNLNCATGVWSNEFDIGPNVVSTAVCSGLFPAGNGGASEGFGLSVTGSLSADGIWTVQISCPLNATPTCQITYGPYDLTGLDVQCQDGAPNPSDDFPVVLSNTCPATIDCLYAGTPGQY